MNSILLFIMFSCDHVSRVCLFHYSFRFWRRFSRLFEHFSLFNASSYKHASSLGLFCFSSFWLLKQFAFHFGWISPRFTITIGINTKPHRQWTPIPLVVWYVHHFNFYILCEILSWNQTAVSYIFNVANNDSEEMSPVVHSFRCIVVVFLFVCEMWYRSKWNPKNSTTTNSMYPKLPSKLNCLSYLSNPIHYISFLLLSLSRHSTH